MSDYKTVLAAVDFSESAATVVEKAQNLARHYQAELLLVHIVEYLPPMAMADEPVPTLAWAVNEEELLERGRQSLQKIAAPYQLDEAHQHVRVGTPKFEIIQCAEQQQVDIIVMGSHGRHGLSRLLGSTANAVLHNAPCDVLAVRLKS